MNVRHRPVQRRRRLRADTRGATVVEYGLILSLVVLITIVGIVSVADVTVGMWNDVAGKVTRAR